MPPRFAYWTILIDDAPTAFRARDREELAGIFRQLAGRNPNVVIKWFSNGRLWESPEEARAARRAQQPHAASRGSDWRPGGRHEDPRARFQRGRDNKPQRPDRHQPQRADRTDGGSRRPVGRSVRSGDAKPAAKWSRDRSRDRLGKPGSERRGKPLNDRPGKSFGNRRKHQGGPKPWQRDRARPKEREEREHRLPRAGGPGDAPVEPEIQPPAQPPGPERPPKPGHEPGPELPAPETIRIQPEPPERGTAPADNRGGRLRKKRR